MPHPLKKQTKQLTPKHKKNKPQPQNTAKQTTEHYTNIPTKISLQNFIFSLLYSIGLHIWINFIPVLLQYKSRYIAPFNQPPPNLFLRQFSQNFADHCDERERSYRNVSLMRGVFLCLLSDLYCFLSPPSQWSTGKHCKKWQILWHWLLAWMCRHRCVY